MDSSQAATLDDVVYPESDGKPMADNTLQWDWMVKIVGELREMFAGQNVFAAGDLFWYPVKGKPSIVTAPDAMVAFGRPPGYRGSYLQWKEDGIAPQVVFEVLSPNNTPEEMEEKFNWYDRYGVEEYYFIDPYDSQVNGWIRERGVLRSILPMKGFVSPRPDGREFMTREERVSEFEGERQRKNCIGVQTNSRPDCVNLASTPTTYLHPAVDPHFFFRRCNSLNTSLSECVLNTSFLLSQPRRAT